MSDVPLLSGISGLSFDSPFLSPLLLFSAQSSCSFCLVIFLLMVYSPDFFPENSQIFFLKGQFFVWLLLSSQEMIVGRWYVQLAAIWHWYLPLCIYITFSNFICLSIPFFIFFFNLVSINQTEWSTIPACPSLMCSFSMGDIEGTNSQKNCVCMFYVCEVIGFDLTEG